MSTTMDGLASYLGWVVGVWVTIQTLWIVFFPDHWRAHIRTSRRWRLYFSIWGFKSAAEEIELFLGRKQASAVLMFLIALVVGWYLLATWVLKLFSA